MGYHRVWGLRDMGYKGVDCTLGSSVVTQQIGRDRPSACSPAVIEGPWHIQSIVSSPWFPGVPCLCDEATCIGSIGPPAVDSIGTSKGCVQEDALEDTAAGSALRVYAVHVVWQSVSRLSSTITSAAHTTSMTVADPVNYD